MRVLVLGGSGFLGLHVLRAALARGHEVWSASREPERLCPARARPLAFDALGEPLERLLAEARPEIVIVCAALSSLARCAADPAAARALNTELPRAAARASARAGLRLVHVSTDLVFDGRPPAPTGYREQDPPAPLSEYGRTKAQGERAVLEADPTALVVRLPLLTGESFGRGAGACDSLYAALAAGARPALFTDEHRTPLDVAEAAQALLALAEERAGPRGLLHVAGAERLSRFEIGLRALAEAGIAPARVQARTRADAGLAHERPADVSLDAARWRALRGRP